jgi:hypothetical protein
MDKKNNKHLTFREVFNPRINSLYLRVIKGTSKNSKIKACDCDKSGVY